MALNRKITREQYAKWEKLYRTKWRQLRRWYVCGEERKDPCPFDRPDQMPAWWTRHFKQVCPSKILEAARDAQRVALEAAPEVAGSNGASEDRQPLRVPVDIEALDVNEGEAVRRQRQLAGAIYNDLREAYAKGWPTDKLQADYIRAVKSLRELERDDREDRVLRGKYLPREIMERDATAAADMLRSMHDSMVRRILEKCHDVPTKYRQSVADALRDVLAAQGRIFQRFNQFTSSDDFLAELTAA